MKNGFIPESMSPAIVVAFGYPRKKLKGRRSRKPLSARGFAEKFGKPPTGELLSAATKGLALQPTHERVDLHRGGKSGAMGRKCGPTRGSRVRRWQGIPRRLERRPGLRQGLGQERPPVRRRFLQHGAHTQSETGGLTAGLPQQIRRSAAV